MKSHLMLCGTFIVGACAMGMQAPPAPAPASAASTPASAEPAQKPPLKAEELEQILAPVALYPDSLLTQLLMASTYPLEVVQAQRFVMQNPSLKDAALATELEKQTWDASVKSLVNFPQVLTMMNDKLDWTIKLGDAFIGQEKDVLDTVQRLRAKANAQGNLKTTPEQKVVVEQAPATTTQIITIESPSPEVIYVPTYNPTVVYGAWPYPSYPPYYYYPPSYNPVGAAIIGFGVGVACGAAWGYAWGHSDWRHGDCDIDVNRNTNFNRNIDRSKYQQQINNRQGNRQPGAGGRTQWQHDGSHRGGVGYRDQATAQKFNNSYNRQAAQARESFRGQADMGRQNLGQGGAGQLRGIETGVGQNRGGAGAGGLQDRGGAGGGGSVQNREATPQNRAAAQSTSGTRSNGFEGVNRGGSDARTASQRGQNSRASSPSPARSAPARSGGGGSRGGGGGSRGGGGGRGGGGRR